MSDRNPVALVDRLAYVLKEWEASHAGWAPRVINGRAVDEEGNAWPQLKTECECQHCKDARVVLADYEERDAEQVDRPNRDANLV